MLRHLKLKMEVKMKTMSFSIDDEKLSEKYQAIWNKIEDLKDVELNVLPVYDDRCIKSKIRTYYHQVYTNIRGLNVSEEDIECECAYKIVNKEMKDYLDDNLFED